MKNKYWIILFIGIIITVIAPYIFTRPAFCDIFNFSETGNIGSTIGGITAPFLSFLGFIMILISFLEQYRANQKLRQKDEADFVFNMFLNLTSTFENFIFNNKKGSNAFHAYFAYAKDEIKMGKIEFTESVEFGDVSYLLDYLDDLIFLSLSSNDIERFQQLKLMDRIASFYKNKLQNAIRAFENSCNEADLYNERLGKILASINEIETRVNDYRKLILG